MSVDADIAPNGPGTGPWIVPNGVQRPSLDRDAIEALQSEDDLFPYKEMLLRQHDLWDQHTVSLSDENATEQLASRSEHTISQLMQQREHENTWSRQDVPEYSLLERLESTGNTVPFFLMCGIVAIAFLLGAMYRKKLVGAVKWSLFRLRALPSSRIKIDLEIDTRPRHKE